MRHALLITQKDLRLGLRDRSVLLMAFVVPFTLALIFSFIFGGDIGSELDVSFLVLNEDEGELGEHFVEGVLGAAEGGLGITVEEVADRPAAAQRVEDGEVDALLVAPAGFSQAVQAGQATTIDVVANVDSVLGRQVATAVARSFAQELTGAQLAVAAVLAAGGEDAPPADEVARRTQATALPVAVVDGRVADNQLDQTTYLAAGMAVFFLFFTVQFGVIGMLEERRDGTLARLHASPIRRSAILGAKTLTSFVLGCVSMAVLLVASELLLGADFGDPAGVTVLVLAGVASAVSLVLLVGTVARTAEQAGTWQSILAIVLGMSGGVFFDVSRGAALLERISLLTPHQWFMRGLGELAGGGGPLDVVPHAAGMLLFGVVMLVAAAILGRTVGRQT